VNNKVAGADHLAGEVVGETEPSREQRDGLARSWTAHITHRAWRSQPYHHGWGSGVERTVHSEI